MDQELKISKQNALAAYREGDESDKKFLSKLFPEENFNRDITEIVTSYEAACELEEIPPLTLAHFSFLPKQDQEYHFADHKMTVIRRQLNQGWVWLPGEYGYYPIFNRPEAAGGAGFSSDGYICGSSSSRVGARRTFKDSRLAKFAGEKFLSIQSIIHNEK